MKKETISEMMREMIAWKVSMHRERTAETYASALSSFMRFREGVDCQLCDLKPRLMQQYEAWLWEKGVTRNTSSFYMRKLRAAYNEAVRRGLVAQAYPFHSVYTGKDKTVKRAIGDGLLRKIRSLDLSGKPWLELARDLFLFSFYTRGMSFVDMAYLRKRDCQQGVLVYCRHKTGQRLQIRYEECIKEIVRKYDNPESPYLLPIILKKGQERQQYLRAQRRVNYGLHRLAEEAKLKAHLTMYVARHSWATLALKSRIPIAIISECLGHESEQMTRIYLASIGANQMDRANRVVIGRLFFDGNNVENNPD